jgi:hypothetical protein
MKTITDDMFKCAYHACMAYLQGDISYKRFCEIYKSITK